MHTKESLLKDLREMGLGPGHVALAHTSMKAIGEVEGRAGAVIDALMGAFPAGLLAMPTLTWSLADEAAPVFDVRRSKTDVGLLPEMFRNRPGVVRSWHPTHSLAAYGLGARALTAADHLCGTPCGRKSGWHKLYERDAAILMIGCTLTSCTFFHGIEEWCDVPGRLAEPVEFTVVTPKGQRLAVTSAPHRGSPSEQYGKAEPALREAGALADGRFGNANVLVMSAAKTYDIVAAILAEDPGYFDG